MNSLLFAVWMFFSWLCALYRGDPLFFWECVHLSLLYLSLIFDVVVVYVCVCVCALEWFWVSLTVIFLLCACKCVFWGFFVNVWQCGFKFTRNFFLIAFVCVFVYTYHIYVCLCVCVCVCVYTHVYIYIYIATARKLLCKNTYGFAKPEHIMNNRECASPYSADLFTILSRSHSDFHLKCLKQYIFWLINRPSVSSGNIYWVLM